MGALTLDVGYHVLLGIALAAVVWAVGLGWLLALRRGRDLGAADAVDGYALGLLACVGAAALALLEAWFAPAAAALLAAPLVVLLRSRARLDPSVARSLRVPAAALPAAAVYGAVLGFLEHGPSATLGSAANGELVFYAAKLVSATQSIAPYHDLLAEGQEVIYAEATPSFLGAVLAQVAGADAFLFHSAAIAPFVVLSLAYGVALLRARDEPLPVAWAVALAALASSFALYPSWLAESPPVAFAAPLALAAFRRGRAPLPLGWVAASSAAVTVALVLT